MANREVARLVRGSLQRAGAIRDTAGAYRTNQIDDPQFQRSRAPNTRNPVADNGPRDAGSIDAKANRREWPAGGNMRSSNADAAYRETIPSKARARRSSDVEDNCDYLYGGPSRRME